LLIVNGLIVNRKIRTPIIPLHKGDKGIS
jgi:hypothetical protein